MVLAGLAAGLLGASAGLAQPEGEATDGESGANIVVTAPPDEPPTQAEVTRQARTVTAETSLRRSPLPRFEGDRLCPGIAGLSTADAGLMVDRIRDTAARLGLWMTDDDGTCTPNFVVAFVDDAQAMSEGVVRARHHLFREMPFHELKELRAEQGPVRVWTATMWRTRDGMSLGSTLWQSSSRIYLASREDIVWVLVLVDRDEAQGKTLLQLADYATMRGLARTRPANGDGQAMDTILALFDPAAPPPRQMTDFDRAYLAALYDGMASMPGITKVHGVNRQLRRQAAEQERD
ncbi:MAG TPA: hypothetical protein VI168_08275 [Croceibacterium sp.]